MQFFKNLFGRVAEQPTPAKSLGTEGLTSSGRQLTERDNAGLRVETDGEGVAFFMSLFQKDPEPLILYFFDTQRKAIAAMADVSCVGIAKDSGRLVCTEILTFGVFPTVDQDGSQFWAALLSGKNLTHDVWSEASECFKKHGGRLRREDEPSKVATHTKTPTSKAVDDPSFVTYLRESREDVAGFPAIRLFYKAPSKAAAIKWLQQNPVDKQSYFLVVETPDGTIVRDIQGIFEP